MTSAASQQFFDTFPPDIARGILESARLRIHAAKVSVVRENGETGFVIDTLLRDGRQKEWERTTQKICRILKNEVERLPAETKKTLAVIAHLMPEETPVPLITVETWLSMKDDSDSWHGPGSRLHRTTPAATVRQRTGRVPQRCPIAEISGPGMPLSL